MGAAESLLARHASLLLICQDAPCPCKESPHWAPSVAGGFLSLAASLDLAINLESSRKREPRLRNVFYLNGINECLWGYYR